MTPAEARAQAIEGAERAIAAKKAMYAQLVGEPFGVPIAAIARLTDVQMKEIYGHARDDRGAIEVPEEPLPVPQTPEEEKAVWFAVCHTLGIPLEKAQAEWELKRPGK